MHLYPLFALLTITVASTAMFVWNVRRSTHLRAKLELERWSRANQLRINVPTPQVVRTLLPAAHPGLSLGDHSRTLLRCATPSATFHLLILRINSDWPPTALRPVQRPASLIDHLPGLRAYPALPGAERFTTHATTLHPAKALAHSPLRTLLPPDVAILLHGPHLLLDFSTRPFDPLEFSRILPLADQLTRNIPAL